MPYDSSSHLLVGMACDSVGVACTWAQHPPPLKGPDVGVCPMSLIKHQSPH